MENEIQTEHQEIHHSQHNGRFLGGVPELEHQIACTHCRQDPCGSHRTDQGQSQMQKHRLIDQGTITGILLDHGKQNKHKHKLADGYEKPVIPTVEIFQFFFQFQKELHISTSFVVIKISLRFAAE